jgi:hypothetical protein
MIEVKLLSRPLPFSGEGLRAYLLRLADTNGIPPKDLTVSNDRVRKYMRIWLDLDETTESAYLDGFTSQFDSNIGDGRLWNFRFSRYCPICLSRSGVWKKEWEMYFVTACPEHMVQLEDQCRSCGSVQTPTRQSLNTCDCGSDLSASIGIHATEHEVMMAREFHLKLEGKISSFPHLQLLDLTQLIKVTELLGRNSGLKIKGSLPSLSRVKIARSYMAIGSTVLFDWPNKYYAFISQVGEPNNKEFKSSLTANYGSFYRTLYKEFKEPCYQFLRYEFECYLQKNWRGPLARRNRRISSEVRENHPWKSLGTIAKNLHRSRQQIEHLITSAELDVQIIRTRTGRKSIMIKSDDVEQLKQTLDDFIDLKTSSEMLGLKKTRVIQLLTLPSLKLVAEDAKTDTGAWKISREGMLSILDLAKGLPVNSIGRHDSSSDRLVSLKFVLRYWLREPSLFCMLMDAVIRKQICPVSVLRNPPTVGDWVFEAASITAWLEEKRRESWEGAFTITDAARQLHISTTAFYFLVKNGHCRTVLSDAVRHPLIPPDAINEFREIYIWGDELAAYVGVGARSVHERLSEIGLSPISGPQVDGGSLNLYQRTAQLELVAIQMKCQN